MKNTNKKNKTKKKSIIPKVLIGVFIVFLLIVSAVYFTFVASINKMEKVTIDKSNLSINEEEIKTYDTHKDIKNIALFGIDSVDGIAGRSDCIMIATLDPVHNKIKATSIMRDSYVNIPTRGMDKINHAYAFGGPELALKTINENFGLNIDSFISVNFSSLPKIIDLLGGVEINITAEEIPHVPNISSEGIHSLDGKQALAYARIRYASGGDYKRTERQRTVLNAVFNKLASRNVTSYPSTLNSILPYVKTNMSANDILALGTKALSSTSNGLEQERFPRDGYCEGANIEGVYYLTFDAETTKKQFMDYIFDDIK